MKRLFIIFFIILGSLAFVSCESAGDSQPDNQVIAESDQASSDAVQPVTVVNQTVPVTDKPVIIEENPAVVKISEQEQTELFKTYVAIGDSVTQGCQGLNVEENRQYYSWPAQLARVMKTEFNQPLVKYPGVGIPNPEDAIREGWVSTYLKTINIMIKTMLYWKRVDSYENQPNLNNFAITAATLDQMLSFDPQKVMTGATPLINDMLGIFNPWTRVTTGLMPQYAKSAVDQALSRNPTFLSVFVGNNDTFISTVIGDPALCTPLEFWEKKWNELVVKIKATKSIKGVLVSNLPDNTNICFLQPINNPFHSVASGVNLPEGSMVPFFVKRTFDKSQVLLPDEIRIIRDRIRAFNVIIKNTCIKENWALVDANAFFEDASKNGMRLQHSDGSLSDKVLTMNYGTGGLISLDGVHPTSTGYARVANIAAQAINAHYKTSLPLVDEVAVWEKDSLCQNPIDPRVSNPELLTNLAFMFNSIFAMIGSMM